MIFPFQVEKLWLRWPVVYLIMAASFANLVWACKVNILLTGTPNDKAPPVTLEGTAVLVLPNNVLALGGFRCALQVVSWVWCGVSKLVSMSNFPWISLYFVGSDACSIEKLWELNFATCPTLQKEIHVHFECVHFVAWKKPPPGWV